LAALIPYFLLITCVHSPSSARIHAELYSSVGLFCSFIIPSTNPIPCVITPLSQFHVPYVLLHAVHTFFTISSLPLPFLTEFHVSPFVVLLSPTSSWVFHQIPSRASGLGEGATSVVGWVALSSTRFVRGTHDNGHFTDLCKLLSWSHHKENHSYEPLTNPSASFTSNWLRRGPLLSLSVVCVINIQIEIHEILPKLDCDKV
jgi:hypothetical protein